MRPISPHEEAWLSLAEDVGNLIDGAPHHLARVVLITCLANVDVQAHGEQVEPKSVSAALRRLSKCLAGMATEASRMATGN